MIIKIQRKLRNELFPMHEHPSFRSGKTAASNKTRPIRLTILRGVGEKRKREEKKIVRSRDLAENERNGAKVETIGDRGVTLLSSFAIFVLLALACPLSP